MVYAPSYTLSDTREDDDVDESKGIKTLWVKIRLSLTSKERTREGVGNLPPEPHHFANLSE